MASDNIILVGFMGTGKTLVGREVARLLGWDFVDTDTEIEQRAGKSVPRVFADDGETSFRSLESKVLSEACSGKHRVVSAGGGAIVDSENRKLMLDRGAVVCLDAEPETIYARLTCDDMDGVSARPLLSAPDPLKRIQELKSERQDFYSAAHFTVTTDELTVEEVAQKVLRSLNLPQSHRDTENSKLSEITENIIGCPTSTPGS